MGRGEEVKVGIGEVGIEELVKREEVKVGIGEVGIEELGKRGRSKSRDRRSRDRGACEEGKE